ncbi:C40 family peptidase [Paenibacillus vietnamensis]|uniref:C40 family peptidase n=1 Tax=Paenibacillus vietnamensis TaxID=2590547 RepID=UPI0029645A07|nr:SH3 domain-containing C40 family peptidase [Paenibacillus vietnamensis]
MNFTLIQRMATATLTAALLFSSISIPAASAAQAAEVKAGVNMRSAPSASAAVIRVLKAGEQLSVIEKVNAYWYKVTDATGKTGYVSTSSQYLSLEASPAPTSPAQTPSPEPAPAQTTNAAVKSPVSLRKAPSTSGELIRYLKTGEQVAVVAKTNSYWYEVTDSSGVRGYVSTNSAYLNVTGSIPGSASGSGSTGGVATPQPAVTGSAAVEKVIAAGLKYLGTPYEYGSSRSTTTTFDCSDFVRQAFLDGVGLKLPASSSLQGQYVKNKGGAKTDWRQLKRGDLVFFMSYKGSKASAYSGIDKSTAAVTHDAIYLGDGKLLHTFSKEGGGVTITTSMAGTAWEYRFLYGGSAL